MNQPQKICLVITQGELGGAQRYVYDLAVGLSKKNFDVTVAVGEGGGRLVEKLKERGIKTHVFTHVVRRISLWHDKLSLFEMRSFFKKEQFDVVHLNSSKVGLTGSIAATMAGVKKIVFTAHGFYFNEDLFFLKKFFYMFIIWFSCLFIDQVIAVSLYDRQSALRYHIVSPTRITTIHNGIDYENLGLDDRESARSFFHSKGIPISADTILIGTIANFYKNKGLEYLIEAARTVSLRATHTCFVIIGEGVLREELEQLVEKYNLQNHVFLVGFIEHAEQYLKAFDIYVGSSLKEGLPYSLLEARAAGVPIVATHVGGVPEIVTGENSVLVPPKNSEKLAEAIIHIYAHGSVHAGTGKRFLLDDMINHTIKIYEA